ncbi:MAG: DEAD/DEAH box helicase [Planctomycetaceae bacterium]|nr:MAG: DEAD/DEAH box helicase [Planctomycetaceae bacterium]
MESFSAWFESATAAAGQTASQPHAWQQQLADSHSCVDRLIRIPTGMGKTLGVLSAWAYHRLHRQDPQWPRRLVWCLPMRTLVDQTAREAEAVLRRCGLADTVAVHRLMGGVDEARWYGDPVSPAVLVGTQDMLLSRALNRGYAMGRAAWPRAFGMIHSDALWVMDEIQLMGVGLTTSAQIQAFWEDDKAKWDGMPQVPRATWWMSATLQPDWLRSPETESLIGPWTEGCLTVAPSDRVGPLWDARKPLTVQAAASSDWPTIVLDAHQQHSADPLYGRQTLVVVNRVKDARELADAIQKRSKSVTSPPDMRLIHSRFRPHDRAEWTNEFLSKQTLGPEVDRILVATQVVEAGVDISASCLLTQLAPWPSLVQRFGRAARYGGEAKIVVLDPTPTDDKQAAPYSLDELDAAREALKCLSSVSIRDLENFETGLKTNDPDSLTRLYPFRPLHVLLRDEFEELFDTSPDLSGADMDVSRFIREGEDQRDVHVFWRTWEGRQPTAEMQPVRDEICAVGIADARAWVTKLTKDSPGAAWAWDYVDGQWVACRADSLRPGMVLLVSAHVGGYDPTVGFTGDKPKKNAETLDLTGRLALTNRQAADLNDGSDRTSEAVATGTERAEFKTIATHADEAARCGQELVRSLGWDEPWMRLIGLVMRLHDWGKAHPAFAQGTYRVEPRRADLAKAPAGVWPKGAWPPPSQMYQPDRDAAEGDLRFGTRAGFRHELVSALATLELLRLAAPQHPALVSNHPAGFPDPTESSVNVTGETSATPLAIDAIAAHPIAAELADLAPSHFNLLLFLIASHHGKVRLSLQASPADQRFDHERADLVGCGMPLRGVREGDPLPSVTLTDPSGRDVEMPRLILSLAPATLGLSAQYGPSWSERMLDLVSSYSPFLLGYLEGIVRAVDAQASAMANADPRLAGISLTVPSIETATAARNAPPPADTSLHFQPTLDSETSDA